LNIYFAMTASLIFAFGGGYLACELIHRLRLPKHDPETGRFVSPEAPVAPSEPSPEPAAFAVAGKPKKPPFRERKKDLRAAARTERKKREEWRD